MNGDLGMLPFCEQRTGKRLTARHWSNWRSNTGAQGVSKIYFSGGGTRNRN
jgi:hypothetical protein